MSYDTRIETASRAGLAGQAGSRLQGEDENGQRAAVADAGVRVRIHTLDRFSVAIDGRQICSTGKAKQRPLALLKALLALGGRSVASSQLWECLWPDSEGDLAVRNLTVTLHRLRHLLETNASILQHDGKLTLNERLCWVDAWGFERAANESLCPRAGRFDGDAAAQMRAALDLYAGHFLARESEESWMFAARLRLRIKFERLATALVAKLENDCAFPEAIDTCLMALERDPLNETLHRSLMCCYLKAGQLAEALRAYRRCREALADGLGATPSLQTERLYLEAVNASAAPRLLVAAGHVPALISTAAHGRRDRPTAQRTNPAAL